MAVYYPVVKVSIYPTDGSGPYLFDKTDDPNADIVSVTVSATIANPRGSFTIDLARRPHTENRKLWHQILKPQDLVIIEMKRGGAQGEAGKFRTVMVGLVDRVNDLRVVGADGQLNFMTQVTGSDFGKFIATPYLHFFKYHQPLDNLGVFSDKEFVKSIFQKTTPSIFIERYWHGAESGGGLADKIWDIELNTPQGRLRPVDLIDLNVSSIDSEVPYDKAVYDREGDLWQLFKEVSEAPWHELFMTYTDPGGGIFGDDQVAPRIMMREAKFKGGGLNIEVGGFSKDGQFVVDQDRTTEVASERQAGSPQQQGRGEGQLIIDEEDVALPSAGEDANTSQLSRGDTEILTVISAKSQLFMKNMVVADTTMPLGINTETYKLFGYREYTATTRLIPDYMRDIMEHAEDLTMDLIEYFQYNQFYWGGQKSFALRPDVRVGTELVDRSEKGVLKAYIEGYQHQWLVGQPCRTTITFSRGVFDNEDIPQQFWKMVRLQPVDGEGKIETDGDEQARRFANNPPEGKP